MAAEGVYPAAAFSFAVRLQGDGSDAGMFREVTGLVGWDVREGSENRYVHRLPTAIKHSKLVLKRGVIQTTSPLVSWIRGVLDMAGMPPVVSRTIEVSLLGAKGEVLRRWSCSNSWPTSWQAERFDADRSTFEIEKIEFACDRVTLEFEPDS